MHIKFVIQYKKITKNIWFMKQLFNQLICICKSQIDIIKYELTEYNIHIILQLIIPPANIFFIQMSDLLILSSSKSSF